LAETGLEHQISVPDVPQPESLPDLRSHYLAVADKLPAAARRVLEQKRPFEFRPVQAPTPLRREKSAGLKYIWFRAVDKLPDDEALHRCLLAYVSDFHLLDTALKPHGESLISPQLVIASIDHAMWFHRSVRVDDWLLYAIDSPSASGARGFTRGSVFARDGQLVASTAQEGLIRVTS
jgi:acyl-CoA thioesterase-2